LKPRLAAVCQAPPSAGVVNSRASSADRAAGDVEERRGDVPRHIGVIIEHLIQHIGQAVLVDVDDVRGLTHEWDGRIRSASDYAPVPAV